MSALRPWTPTAPLEPGIALVEASAGTGKTYNITSLVLRLVAEQGVTIDRVLVVTYTRAATAELKDRIRNRLTEAVSALSGEGPQDDVVLAHLTRCDESTRRLRLRRLRAAVEGFDQALISTIHGFCQRMLQQNAFESGAAFDLELVPDLSDLVEELVDDHLATLLYEADASQLVFYRDFCRFTRDGLLRLADTALSDPDVRVLPDGPVPDLGAWPEAVETLARAWPDLAGELVAAIEAEVTASKAGTGCFKPRQRTFTRSTIESWAQGIATWLRSDPPLGSLPPAHDRFEPAKMAKQLVDPDVPFNHPAIEALDALCAVPYTIAGALRARFVRDVRERFDTRKAARRVQAYQDLLRGLARRLDPLAGDPQRHVLAEAVGSCFDAALIDEFQDTDADQWTIFREAFGKGRHHLYLIGDPKQAIYGFRGANIHVYALASEQAGERRFTMSTNWRSDRRLLHALNHLLDREHAFGPEVPFGYVRVDAPQGRGADGLQPPDPESPDAAPLQLRWFDGSTFGRDDDGPLNKTLVADALEALVAEDVVELLRSGTQIRADGQWRALRPGDLAVLVRKGRQATAIQEALTDVGVPAVLTGAASVLASDEALVLQYWLQALVEPHSRSAARVAASTRLFGWTAHDLRHADDDPVVSARWEEWLARLVEHREILHRQGFMPAFRRMLGDHRVLARLLALRDGERRVTNLMHVAELLHAAEVRDRLGPGSLLTWLSQRRSDEDLDSETVELRLDREADAVHILTMHKSKGLEFPVVFVPYLWDGGQTQPRESEPLLVPDPGDPTRRLLDVGIPVGEDHRRRAEREAKEEALRLAYVALTRARHRCVVYTGPVRDYEHSPLAAILHGSGPDRLSSGRDRVADGPEALRADLHLLVQRWAQPGSVPLSVRDCTPVRGSRWEPPLEDPPELSVRRFGRKRLDPGWKRHSYSSLTRAAAFVPVTVPQDEAREGFDADPVERVPLPPLPSEDVPLATFPAGPDAGTLIHEVLEELDFVQAVSEPDHVAAVVDRLVALHGFDPQDATVLAAGLEPLITTPLGGPLGELRLADLPRTHRLDELRFDLPILGGSTRRGAADVHRPAREVVAALRQRDDGVLPAEWLVGLERIARQPLAGFLTGSIDLVFRAPSPGDERWYVVDYKSNRLVLPDGRCAPEAFSTAGMAREMASHDYFLQYHLYLVALHRYLGWRLPDYDYDRHVGGVYYLFLRGMLGPDTLREGERVRGCWFDRPSRAVVEALDRALRIDGGEA